MAQRKEDVVLDVIINGEKATSNLKELNTTTKQLWKEIQSLTPGTEAFIKKAEEIQKVTAHMNAVKASAKGMSTVIAESQTTFKGLWTDVAKGGVALQAFNALQNAANTVLSNSVAEATNAERSQRMLQNTLRNYDKEKYFDALIDDAETLAKTFSYLDNDDIVASQEKLVLYGKVTGNQMKDLLKLAIDLSARIGVGLPEATGLLIKSLEGNAKPLKEFGINMKDGGDVTERMQILLTELAPKLEGSARDFEKSSEGIAASTRKMRADMEEELGNKLIPLLNRFYSTLNKVMDGANFYFSGADGKVGMRADAIQKQQNLIPQQIMVIEKWQTAANNAVKNGTITQDAAHKFLAQKIEAHQKELQARLANTMKNVGANDMNELIEPAAQLKAELNAFNAAKEKVMGSTLNNEVIGPGNTASAGGGAKASAERAAREAAQQKKHAQDLAAQAKKNEQELQAQLLEIEKDAATARLSLITDEFEKETAIENNRHNNALSNIDKELLALKQKGATKQQITKAEAEMLEIEEIKHRENLSKIEADHNKKIQDEQQKAHEEQMRIKKEHYQEEEALINAAFDKNALEIERASQYKIEREQATQDGLLALQDEEKLKLVLNEEMRNNALILLQEKHGMATVDAERRIVELKNEQYQRDAKNKEATETYKRQIGGAALGFFKDLVAGEIDMLSQTEESRKKNANKIKTMQFTQVYLDGVQEVASIWQNVQRIDNSGGNVYYAQILGALLTAASVTRTGFALNKINSAKFYHGGHTGPGIGINDSQGTVAGVVHKNEWVSPEWMTNHPAYSPVIAWLESNRLRGYMSGGYTTTPTNFAVGMATGSGFADFQALRADMAAYHYQIANWKTQLTAHVSATEADTELKNLETLKKTFQA